MRGHYYNDGQQLTVYKWSGYHKRWWLTDNAWYNVCYTR